MLYYIDELITAANANPSRRRFNTASAVFIILVGAALIGVGASTLIFVTVISVDLVVHVILVVRWARKDALAAYRQREREP